MKKTLLALSLLSVSTMAMAQTVATVNGEALDSKDVDYVVKMYTEYGNGKIKDTPDVRKIIVNQLAADIALEQEARKQKIEQRADVKQAIAQVKSMAEKSGDSKKPNYKANFNLWKRKVLINALGYSIGEKYQVSDADLNAEYARFKAYYDNTKEVKLNRVVAAKASIDTMLKDLKKGKKFTDLASDDIGKKVAGNWVEGYVNYKDLQAGAPAIYEAVKSLKKGQYTPQSLGGEPVAALFFVEDIRSYKIPALEQVKEMLSSNITGRYVEQEMQKIVEKSAIKIQ